ncbi:MAG: NUMOD3 domain-containing DNA-binding protein [Novosphingobium sp.]|nr:NUMOD3 domain-containing DNA-binding protein [Novosphingobium sp.]
MNYQKIYNDLIENAKSKNRKRLKRDNPKFVYYERHHIVPRCMGGQNDKENLVLLTAREHFVAHKLLVEIYPKNGKLYCAIFKMINCSNKFQDRNYIVSSREYDKIRKEFSDFMSKLKKGKRGTPHTEEFKKYLSKKFKGRKVSEETKEKLRERVVSPETRLKMREARLGKVLSKTTKEKISKNTKGKNNPMYGKGYLLIGEKNGRFGKEVSLETRKKISDKNKGNKMSDELKKKMSDNWSKDKNPMYNSNRFGELNPFYNKKHSSYTINLISEKSKNRKRVKCPHCNKILDISNAKRWHFDNCKYKKLTE